MRHGENATLIIVAVMGPSRTSGVVRWGVPRTTG